jgi:hypothetical protein
MALRGFGIGIHQEADWAVLVPRQREVARIGPVKTRMAVGGGDDLPPLDGLILVLEPSGRLR